MTYIGQVIKEVMESRSECHNVLIPVTMVTGVRHNEQTGDLETGEGELVTIGLMCVQKICIAFNC